MNGFPRLAAAGTALVAIVVIVGVLFVDGPKTSGSASATIPATSPTPVRSMAASPSVASTPSVSAAPSVAPAPSGIASAQRYQAPLGLAIVGLDGTVRQDLKMPADAWAPDLTADGRDVFLLTRSKDVVHCFGCGNPGAWPAVVTVGDASGLYICCDISGFAEAAWSPDGTSLAYQVAGKDGNLDIYVVPVVRDGSGISVARPTRLTTDPAPDGWPAWSPDGSTIYYTNDGAQAADTSGFSDTQEIWRVPATGGTPQRLTDNSEADLQPDVAADGTVVYWEGGEIRTMAADGTEQHRLVAIPSDIGFNPRWSPDGSKVAVLKLDPSNRALFDPAIRQPADLALLDVVVVDVATGDATTVGPRVASFFNPVSWTPDGTALLINRFDDGS